MIDHPGLSEQRALIERLRKRTYIPDADFARTPESVHELVFNLRKQGDEAADLLEAAFAQPPASGVDRSREASGYRKGVRDAAELSKAHDARGDTAKGILRLLKQPAALTNSGAPVPGDGGLRAASFERDDECNVEFHTVPDCDCPHEHWHVNGVCLDVHIEEDRSGHIILTLEDDPIELQISGVADISEARTIAFAWAAKKLCLAPAAPAPSDEAGCICEVVFGQNHDCPLHGDGTAWRAEHPEADMRDCPAGTGTEAGVPAGMVQPIDMLLFCPKCGIQHIDWPDDRSPDWDNPPHRSHLCHACGCIWRPADVPTNGVAAITTQGKADTWGESNSAALAKQATLTDEAVLGERALGWQGIRTHPGRGKHRKCMIYSEQWGVSEGLLFDDGKWGVAAFNGQIIQTEPKAWQPLPDAPESPAPGSAGEGSDA